MMRMRNWYERFPRPKQYYDETLLQRLDLIAKYSFNAQKSINYLDLSLHGYASLKERRKLIPLRFTSYPAHLKSCIRPVLFCPDSMIVERRWLHTFHLDLPRGREDNSIVLSEDEGGKIKQFCFDELSFTDDIYRNTFISFIEEALNQKGKEIDFLRRLVTLIKKVLGIRLFEEVDSIEDRILNLMYPECTDSKIVQEFLSMIDFNSWVLTDPKQDVLEYLLHHAYQSRYDLKMNDREGSLVNECFFEARFKYTELLLQYHNAPFYYDYSCYVLLPSWVRNKPTDWHPEFIETPFKNGLMSSRRCLLWLQVFYAYAVRNQPPFNGSVSSALRLLWRSLPDAYFTLDELTTAYQDVPSVIDAVIKAHKFYLKTIAGDLEAGHLRSLQHCCRITIRKSLCFNLKLPYGISQLCLPDKLKEFLKLEK